MIVKLILSIDMAWNEPGITFHIEWTF